MSRESAREISDPKTMRALAHPVRLALLDAIRAEGEITASRAAELLGDSPGNMSWHLQTLAKYGFVEESGTGKGRSRPWRLIDRYVRFDSLTEGEPEAIAAGEALEAALIDRSFDQLQAWRRRRAAYPEWINQAFTNSAVTYLTPAELAQLAEDLGDLFNRYAEREDPAARPPGVLPVKLFGAGHPMPTD